MNYTITMQIINICEMYYNLLSHFSVCIMLLSELGSAGRLHTDSVLTFKPEFTH